jgi:hypothetical protein
MAIRARTKLPLVLLLQRRLRVAKHQHPTLTMTTSRPDRFSRLSRATTVDLDSAAAEGSNLPPRLYRRSRLPLLLSHPRLFHPRQATRAHSLPLRGRILAASRRRAAAAAEEESISVRRWRRFASSLRQATTRLPLCRRRRSTTQKTTTSLLLRLETVRLRLILPPRPFHLSLLRARETAATSSAPPPSPSPLPVRPLPNPPSTPSSLDTRTSPAVLSPVDLLLSVRSP